MANNQDLEIIPDGHFLSTMAQFQKGRGILGFSFVIDDSQKVRDCKHKIFGNAQYVFERSNLPMTFNGEFQTDQQAIYCCVTGFRVNKKYIIKNDSLVERYQNLINHAIKKKWINSEQIRKSSPR